MKFGRAAAIRWNVSVIACSSMPRDGCWHMSETGVVQRSTSCIAVGHVRQGVLKKKFQRVNPIPDTGWLRRSILQSLQTTNLVAVVPPIKRGARNTQPVQRLFGWQMRSFNKANDVKFFRGRVSHSSSPPPPIMLFLSNLSSMVCSATTSFNSTHALRGAGRSPHPLRSPEPYRRQDGACRLP